MKAVKKYLEVPISSIILIFLLIASCAAIYYFIEAEESKLSTIIGGIGGGLVVYIIGYILSIYKYKSIDRFRELGVKEILPNRRGTDYYNNLIRKANDRVVVTGTSCTRFINDFADEDSDEHTLIDVLRENKLLKVQFLVPKEKYMDESSKVSFKLGQAKLKKLISDYPERIEMRQYSFEPRYSFVRVDSDLIVGPVFSGTESKNSPAIHLDVNSSFSEKYLQNFNQVWDSSTVYT